MYLYIEAKHLLNIVYTCITEKESKKIQRKLIGW